MYRLFSLLILLTFFSGCFSSKHKKIKIPTNDTKPHVESRDFSGKKYALIVSTGNYKGTSKDLPGIHLDAARMKSKFQKWGFEIKHLEGKQTVEFEKVLNDYSSLLKKDDVFILYFSGHGSSTRDNSGDEIDDDKDELIVVSDGEKNIFIVDDLIERYLQNIKSRKLIIFDSCNSGTVTRAITHNIKYIKAPPGVGDKNLLPAPTYLISPQPGPQLFFAACEDDEKSLSSKDGSLFTNTLIKTLDIEKSPVTIHRETLNKISRYFHPTLYTSDDSIINEPLKYYLKIK
jgi:hypothetical protein